MSTNSQLTNEISLGPWPVGVNNTADSRLSVFEPGSEQTALRDAVNLDLMRDGWLRRRKGYTLRASLTNGHSLFDAGAFALCVDDNQLLKLTLDEDMISSAPVAVGDSLRAGPMSYAMAGDKVYCCNGAQALTITTDGGWLWSLPAPSAPTLIPSIPGALKAGTYRVALAWVDMNGAQHGASVPEVIELVEDGSIEVTLADGATQAEYLRVFVTDQNGKDLFQVMQLSANTTTFTITNLAEATVPLRTANLLGVPTGAHIARLFKGRMIVATGNTLYWSEALEYHLFDQSTSAQMFAERITMIEPMDDGFYLSEGKRTWWVTGDDPKTWAVRQVDGRAVFEGAALRLPASKIPSLQTQGMVCVWITKDGPIAGLNSGVIVPLSEKRIAFDPSQRASFGYREHNGLAQFLVSLKNKKAGNAFKAYDTATCTVTKAT